MVELRCLDATEPRRYAGLAAGRGLEELDEAELRGLLERSRPH